MDTGTLRLKVGLAEMLKGGVIMDVTTAEQAKIAEDAGAVAVMALERVPADIRAQGGVARMASVFKALSDETRLRILGLLLTGEVCVCHIHESLKIPQPKASRHSAQDHWGHRMISKRPARLSSSPR